MAPVAASLAAVTLAANDGASNAIALLLVVLAMVVPALAFRHDHRARRAARGEARWREAALILGPASELVHAYGEAAFADVENADDTVALLGRMKALTERHDREVRPALMAITPAFPRAEREAAGRLLTAMENLSRTAIELVMARRAGEGDNHEERQHAAGQASREALAAIGDLGRLLRPEPH